MRHYFPAGPSTEHFRPPRNQRGRNRQPDVCGRAEAAGRPELPPPDLVGAAHHCPVYVLPVATARAVCVGRTSAYASHDSSQRRHCSEDAQTPGDSIVQPRHTAVSVRHSVDNVVSRNVERKDRRKVIRNGKHSARSN